MHLIGFLIFSACQRLLDIVRRVSSLRPAQPTAVCYSRSTGQPATSKRTPPTCDQNQTRPRGSKAETAGRLPWLERAR